VRYLERRLTLGRALGGGGKEGSTTTDPLASRHEACKERSSCFMPGGAGLLIEPGLLERYHFLEEGVTKGGGHRKTRKKGGGILSGVAADLIARCRFIPFAVMAGGGLVGERGGESEDEGRVL